MCAVASVASDVFVPVEGGDEVILESDRVVCSGLCSNWCMQRESMGWQADKARMRTCSKWFGSEFGECCIRISVICAWQGSGFWAGDVNILFHGDIRQCMRQMPVSAV